MKSIRLFSQTDNENYETSILAVNQDEHSSKDIVDTGNIPFLEYIKSGVKKKVFITKDKFLIGKSVKSVDFLCDEEGVSRLHAQIVKDKNKFCLEDLNSTNGTYLNDIKIESGKRHYLENKDILKFAEKEYIFFDFDAKLDNFSNYESKYDTQLLFSNEITSNKKYNHIACLVSDGKKIQITKNPFTLGKNSREVDYLCLNNSVSRVHAQIIFDGNQYYIMDMGSKNGTYINGNIILSHIKYPLDHQDMIKLANMKFLFTTKDIVEKAILL